MKADKAIDFTNKYAGRFESKVLRWLTSWPIIGLSLHWVFQSMLYMDATERHFKLALDVLLTGVGCILLSIWLPWRLSWLLAFLLAHTLNFLFNAQLWVVLKHYGFVNQSDFAFRTYAEGIARRINKEPSLIYAAIYGSSVRGEWRPASDLDLRLVRYPGGCNGIKACLFVLKERTRAFFCHFPLDVYVLDSAYSLHRLRSDEQPTILLEAKPDSI